MGLDPDVLESKPRSKIAEWLYYRNEQTNLENWRAEEAAWRASRGGSN
jgi:hypothetical protein